MDYLYSCLHVTLLALFAAHAHHTNAAATAFSSAQVLPLRATAFGTAFTATVTFGDQPLNLLLDTGSSDLWVLGSEWKCYSKNETGILGSQTSRDACVYGNRTYGPTQSYTPNNNSWLGIRYGAGDVIGTVGREQVYLGSLLLPDQEFGIALATNGPADGYSEGIMGLGYPILSQTHPRNYTAQTSFDLLRNTLPSQTVTLSLVEQLEEPYFAFALERTPRDQEQAFGGYVSFGTLPPVQYSEEWTTVPVEFTEAVPIALTGGTRQRTYPTTTVESVSWGNETYDSPYQAVVDTGNFYFIVPEQLAEQVASAFNPPGVYEPDGPLGPLYAVRCDATPPSNVSITLGGTSFNIDTEDLIYQDFDGSCFSTFAPTVPLQGIELFFLSSHFLRNVVAVFDYQNDEMRLAKRIRNDTASDPEPTMPVQVENGAPVSSRRWPTFIAVLVVAMVLI